MENVVWSVYVREGYGSKSRIVPFNIFDHGRFRKNCRDNAKRYYGDRENLLEAVRGDLLYYFWGKFEWETLIGPYPTEEDNKTQRKIDPYDQVMHNWAAFSEYVWAHRDDLCNLGDEDEEDE